MCGTIKISSQILVRNLEGQFDCLFLAWSGAPSHDIALELFEGEFSKQICDKDRHLHRPEACGTLAVSEDRSGGRKGLFHSNRTWSE